MNRSFWKCSLSVYFILPAMLSFVVTACRPAISPVSFTGKDVRGTGSYLFSNDSSSVYFSKNGRIFLPPITWPAGRYTMSFTAAGESAYHILPSLFIYIGETLIIYKDIEDGKKTYKINFELPENNSHPIQLEYGNDFSGEEDRNMTIIFPITIKPYNVKESIFD